jgi:hypothetical protein
MTVADVDGPWMLELRVPDRRVAHVMAAQQAMGEDLDVSFVLAAEPGVRLRGKIDRLGTRTEVGETDDAFVLATVAVDREALPERTAGASVVANVYCGRRSVGYVWLHDLWDAIQTWVLF